MSAHTNEPWSLYIDQIKGDPDGRSKASIVATGITVCEMYYPVGGVYGEVAEANARRIVACVNELIGVHNPTGYVHRLEKDRDELAALLVKGRDLMVEAIAIQNNTAEQRAKLLEIAKLQLAEAERVEAIMLREAGIGVTDRIKIEKARALIAEIEAAQ